MGLSENCYFWVDETIPEDDRGLSIMCVACAGKHPERSAWFWEGSRKGYGKYDLACDDCGVVIHTGVPEKR